MEVVRQCEDRFEIHVGQPLTHKGGTHVFLATRAHEDLVLKIGLNETDVTREVYALNGFSGHGAIDVIDFDGALSALLLQRARPGHPLSTLTDDRRATEIFGSVVQRLHPTLVTGDHESLQEHCAAIGRYQQTLTPAGPLPRSWLHRAVEYLNSLVSSTDHPVLLHGDLHHANILRHQDEWVCIDPKGIIGDLHFEVFQYLLNHPNRQGDADIVLARRMAMVTERLGLDAQRI